MFKRTFTALLFASALCLAMGIALGFFGEVHPAFDSFSHFRAHLAVLLGIAGILLLGLRRWRFGIVAVAASLLAIATTSGAVPAIGMRYGALSERDPKLATYTVLHFNLLYNNQTREPLLSLIGRLNPDVLALNEVSPWWLNKLALIKATYRYELFCAPGENWTGVAIISRRPFANGGKTFCDDGGSLAIAPVDFGGQVIDIGTVHLNWPWPRSQNADIDRLMPAFGSLGPDAILTGDLNAVPWSRAAFRVAEAGGLTHMPSPGATWLFRKLPEMLFPLGLPIDNIFAKGDVLVQSVKSLAPEGSDHLPLLVTFSIKPAGDEPMPTVDLVEAR